MNANPDVIKEPSSVPFVVTVVILIATLIGLGGAIFINLSDQSEDSQYLAVGGDLRVSVQQVFSGARLAVEGDEVAFESLVEAQEDFSSSMSSLRRGSDGVTPLRSWLPNEYNQLNTTWESVSGSIDTILANKDRILFLHDVAETLSASIPELQQEYNLVVDILVDGGSRSEQAVLAQRQALLGERIARNIDKMLEGGADAADAADQFNLDASLFGSVLEGMIDGNAVMRIDKVVDEEALESLAQIDELYAFVNNSVDKIFQASPDLLNTRQSVDLILGSAEQLNTDLDTLIAEVDSIAEKRWMKQIYIYAIAGLAVVLLMVLFLLAGINARRRLELEEQTNEASQRAILTLLDELADLADGDLRTKATVTEEFTGAIADSVNFTIDQLRVLVSRITESSRSISDASQQAKNTSEELSSAADQQASEIAEATLSINEMADTIGQVSGEAADSATVAIRSVDIAKNGSLVVRNTIGGMDTIREQIQDTSKRIKRLGESSQEIGDIVSLINDIADQTNILSLNAAIQASMAGDAGRGFAVVADEVQRLAERSSAATKQIEALVKAIQTDTNEAVISMEQTTTEVVKGARLAQDAGVALEEIETASTDIAKLIQDISVSAGTQAQKAIQVSERMNVIQDITTQTSSGTKATADSIGTLTTLSIDMRDSVAGFSLPVDELVDSDDLMGIEDTMVNEDAMEDIETETLGEADVSFDEDEAFSEDAFGELAETDETSEFDDAFSDDAFSDLADMDETSQFSEDLSDDSDSLQDETLQMDSLQTVQMNADDDEDEFVIDDIGDDDDAFEALLDDADDDIVVSAEADEIETLAVDESLEGFDISEDEQDNETEEDEFMLGLEDDFDLDLDDFSFDDDTDQKA